MTVKDLLRTDNLFEEQGDLVADHIMKRGKETSGPSKVYIISPFTVVKDGLKKF
ncbi:hypothetical protein PJ311_00570 [Bacillus sp. CLL-7-23]|uniref:Uncharacterized protein n=1 Tax=Bacillus changyiensis TaxID=3004103 RepID=A0ABT4WYI1_9BACI|nr:hypothetical protein [Bacillus changyiensis]MDA7025097.1 hypothetical protein [Bacillus changyiensis]